MDLLHNDIISLIIEYLNVKEKYNFSFVCKKYLKYRPNKYYVIFYSWYDYYTADEFIAISDNLKNAKLIIDKLNHKKYKVYIGSRINRQNNNIDTCYIIEPNFINIPNINSIL